MPSSQPGTSRPSRRIFMLAAAIAAAIVLYSAGWLFLSGKLADEANRAIVTANAHGIRTSCENLETRGYPFRLGLSCNSVLYEDRGSGIFYSSGALHTASQIYNPALVRAEIEAPARIELPGLAPLDLTWDWLGLSMRHASPLPERLSVSAAKLNASIAEGYSFGGGELFTAQEAEIHLRPSPKEDIDFAAMFRGIRLAHTPDAPVFGLDADLAITSGLPRLLARDTDPRGLAVQLRNVAMMTGDGGVIGISGPLKIDDSGLVDGELVLKIDNAPALSRTLPQIFPEYAKEIDTTLAALSAGSKDGEIVVTLRIVKGKVFAGLFQLAQIPPL